MYEKSFSESFRLMEIFFSVLFFFPFDSSFFFRRASRIDKRQKGMNPFSYNKWDFERDYCKSIPSVFVCHIRQNVFTNIQIQRMSAQMKQFKWITYPYSIDIHTYVFISIGIRSVQTNRPSLHIAIHYRRKKVFSWPILYVHIYFYENSSTTNFEIAWTVLLNVVFLTPLIRIQTLIRFNHNRDEFNHGFISAGFINQ